MGFASAFSKLSPLALLLASAAILQAVPIVDYQSMTGYMYQYKSQSDVQVDIIQSDIQSDEQHAVNSHRCEVDFEIQLVSKNANNTRLLRMFVTDVRNYGTGGLGWLDLGTRIELLKGNYFEQDATGNIIKIYREKGEKPNITNFKRTIVEAFATNGAGQRGERVAERGVQGEQVLRNAWDESHYVEGPQAAAMEAFRDQGGIIRGERVVQMSEKSGLIKQMDCSVSLDLSQSMRGEEGGDYTSQTRVNNASQLILKGSRPLLIKPVFDAKKYEATSLAMEALSELAVSLKMPNNFQEATAFLRSTGKAADWLGTQLKAKGKQLPNYLDLVSALAQEGSPAGQKALMTHVLKNAKVDDAALQRALLGLAHVKAPQDPLLETVVGLVGSVNEETRRAAITALGSLVGRFKGEKADSYLRLLIDYAKRPWDEKELLIAISALGNAGQENATDLIASFLDHTAFQVRREAVDALRKLSSDRALGLLATKAEQDSHPAVRMKALQVLTSKMPVSAAPDPNMTVNRTWGKKMGWSDFNTLLSGRMVATKQPAHVELVHEVSAKAWKNSASVGRVEVACDAVNGGQASTGVCNAYVMGEKLYCSDRLQKAVRDGLGCSVNMNETWDSGPFDTGLLEVSLPVVTGVEIKLKGSLTGKVGVNVKAQANACNPNAIFAESTVTPQFSIKATGGASVVFMGMLPVGVTVEGAINNGKLPLYGKLGVNDGKTFTGAIKVDLGMDAASLKLSGQVAIFNFPLVTLNMPAKQFTLVDYKWPNKH